MPPYLAIVDLTSAEQRLTLQATTPPTAPHAQETGSSGHGTCLDFCDGVGGPPRVVQLCKAVCQILSPDLGPVRCPAAGFPGCVVDNCILNSSTAFDGDVEKCFRGCIDACRFAPDPIRTSSTPPGPVPTTSEPPCPLEDCRTPPPQAGEETTNNPFSPQQKRWRPRLRPCALTGASRSAS